MTEENKYYDDDLECENITDNIITYYQDIQADDDEEVKEITGKILSHFMRIGFDDMSITAKEATTRISDVATRIGDAITNALEDLH